jgi:DNA-binding protein YbaB
VTGELPRLTNGPATPEINAALRARFEVLLDEFERVKDNASKLQRRLHEAEGAAASKDGAVKLTVGPRGDLRTLHIDPRAYRRLSPSELATEILELSRAAARDVQAQLEQVIKPFLPPDLTYQQVADGEVDPGSWHPSQASMQRIIESWGVDR